MSEQKDHTEPDTAEMMTINVADIDDVDALGNELLAGLSGQLGIPRTTKWAVAEMGHEAKRPEEFAFMTNKFMTTNPHMPGQPGFYGVVKFADGNPHYINMQWPRYAWKKKPPWMLKHDVYVEVRQDDGTYTRAYSHTERPEHKKGYLVFLPQEQIRPAYRVREEFDV